MENAGAAGLLTEFAAGCRELYSGEAERAISRFRQIAGWSARAPYSTSMLGRAYLESGDAFAAGRGFAAILGAYTPNRTEWPIVDVKARYYHGRALEEAGEVDEAIARYTEFLDLWREADFASAELADARERLTRLQHTP